MNAGSATLQFANVGNALSVKIHKPEERSMSDNGQMKPTDPPATEKPPQKPAKANKPASAADDPEKRLLPVIADNVKPRKPRTPRRSKGEAGKGDEGKSGKGGKGKAPAQPKTTSVQPAPAPVPESPASKPNRLDKLRNAFGSVETSQVIELVQMAEEGRRDQGTVASFVEAVEAACAVVEQHLGHTVRQDWYKLSFSQWENMLKQKAERNSALNPTLQAMDNCRKAVTTEAGESKITLDLLESLLFEPLWDMWTQVAGPAKEIDSFPRLADFLRSLKDKKLVESQLDRSRNRDKAITTRTRDGHTLYWLPAKATGGALDARMDATWQFVQGAWERAKGWADKRREQCGRMKSHGNQDFTFAKAKAGKEDRRWFDAEGENRGAILHFSRNEVQVECGVSIPRTVRLPSRWISLDSQQSDWPEEIADLYHAFDRWRQTTGKKEKPAKAPPASAKPQKEQSPAKKTKTE